MVSFGTHTCKSAKLADHVSGKYYTVSTCGHSLIHMCTCMEVIIRRRIGFINAHHLIIYPGTEDITVCTFFTVIQASCQCKSLTP